MGVTRDSVFTSVLLVIVFLVLCSTAHAEFATVNGAKLYYESAGKGRNLILIHGGLADSRVWDYQFRKLSKRFRVIRYDLRGYGRSDFPKAGFSHIEDLRELLLYLKISRTSIVGLSIGGVIAADFALDYPQFLDRLILVSSGLRGDDSPVDPKTIEVFKSIKTEGVEKAIDLWLQTPLFSTIPGNQKLEARTRQMLRDNFGYWGATERPIPVVFPPTATIGRLPEIKVPTLVVAGDKDAAYILKIAETLRSRIAGAELFVLNNVSHHLNLEKPKRFNRLVTGFLRKGEE